NTIATPSLSAGPTPTRGNASMCHFLRLRNTSRFTGATPRGRVTRGASKGGVVPPPFSRLARRLFGLPSLFSSLLFFSSWRLCAVKLPGEVLFTLFFLLS